MSHLDYYKNQREALKARQAKEATAHDNRRRERKQLNAQRKAQIKAERQKQQENDQSVTERQEEQQREPGQRGKWRSRNHTSRQLKAALAPTPDDTFLNANNFWQHMMEGYEDAEEETEEMNQPSAKSVSERVEATPRWEPHVQIKISKPSKCLVHRAAKFDRFRLTPSTELGDDYEKLSVPKVIELEDWDQVVMDKDEATAR